MYKLTLSQVGGQLGLCSLLYGSVLVSDNAFAAVSVSQLNNITIAAWAGATGNLVGSDTYCTVSCRGNCRRRGQRRDYDTAIYSAGETDNAGNFYISNGANRLLVYVDWTHPVSGTTRMTNFNVTGLPSPRVAGAYSCSADPNALTAIDVTLPAAQLAGAEAGVYSETFEVDICRFGGGGYAECSNRVNFSVSLPELVQVSGLDDVSLGIWSGVGDLQVTQSFCIFRNGRGGVAVRSNGSHDAAGSFNLQGAGGSIPYKLEYRQSGGFLEAGPGASLSALQSGFVGESVRDCTNVGGTNTTVRIGVNAADIGARAPGIYTDTVTIYVEPD